jgi:hypothetical protein
MTTEFEELLERVTNKPEWIKRCGALMSSQGGALLGVCLSHMHELLGHVDESQACALLKLLDVAFLACHRELERTESTESIEANVKSEKKIEKNRKNNENNEESGEDAQRVDDEAARLHDKEQSSRMLVLGLLEKTQVHRLMQLAAQLVQPFRAYHKKAVGDVENNDTHNSGGKQIDRVALSSSSNDALLQLSPASTSRFASVPSKFYCDEARQADDLKSRPGDAVVDGQAVKRVFGDLVVRWNIARLFPADLLVEMCRNVGLQPPAALTNTSKRAHPNDVNIFGGGGVNGGGSGSGSMRGMSAADMAAYELAHRNWDGIRHASSPDDVKLALKQMERYRRVEKVRRWEQSLRPDNDPDGMVEQHRYWLAMDAPPVYAERWRLFVDGQEFSRVALPAALNASKGQVNEASPSFRTGSAVDAVDDGWPSSDSEHRRSSRKSRLSRDERREEKRRHKRKKEKKEKRRREREKKRLDKAAHKDSAPSSESANASLRVTASSAVRPPLHPGMLPPPPGWPHRLPPSQQPQWPAQPGFFPPLPPHMVAPLPMGMPPPPQQPQQQQPQEQHQRGPPPSPASVERLMLIEAGILDEKDSTRKRDRPQSLEDSAASRKKQMTGGASSSSLPMLPMPPMVILCTLCSVIGPLGAGEPAMGEFERARAEVLRSMFADIRPVPCVSLNMPFVSTAHDVAVRKLIDVHRGGPVNSAAFGKMMGAAKRTSAYGGWRCVKSRRLLREARNSSIAVGIFDRAGKLGAAAVALTCIAFALNIDLRPEAYVDYCILRRFDASMRAVAQAGKLGDFRGCLVSPVPATIKEFCCRSSYDEAAMDLLIDQVRSGELLRERPPMIPMRGPLTIVSGGSSQKRHDSRRKGKDRRSGGGRASHRRPQHQQQRQARPPPLGVASGHYDRYGR